jgi:hypothetical protein
MGAAQLKVGLALVAVFAISLGVVAANASDDPTGGGGGGGEAGDSASLADLADAPGRGGGNVGDTAGIVGGNPVTIDQFPWQVAIAASQNISDADAFQRQGCGGTLLTPTIVLTAAHCVVNEKGRFRAPPSNFSVISGRTKLTANEGIETVVSDYRYFVDAQNRQLYDPRNNAWDVVLLILPEPALGTPVQIAGPDEAATWAPGTAALVSGWGSVQGGSGPFPENLLAATIEIFSDRFCARVVQNVDPTSVCAGVRSGARDTCSGDSGGPLVVTTATGEHRLVGATSYGPDPCGQPNQPGVYTRVADEPIRSSVQAAVQQIAGVDVVGTGGTPAQ